MVAQGQKNKDAALSNILLKRDILLVWKVDGLPKFEQGYEYFPRTIRQFNFWDLSQNSHGIRSSFPSIKRNANDTLNKYLSARQEVSSLIVFLKNYAAAARPQGDRLSVKISQLKEQKEYAHLLEKELILIRQDRADLSRRVKGLTAKIDSITHEFRSVVEKLESEISDLRKENAGLISASRKISSLRTI